MNKINKALQDYKPGKWYQVNTIDEMQEFYLSRLPAIKAAAKECGYAIAVHGSCRRDFDLMAMQWVEDCSDIDTLAKAIQKAACGFFHETYDWENKPNGRKAASFPICWCNWHDMVSAGHIDLSVMQISAGEK